jgi:MYXO-CTERM domain-containing protein
VQGVTEGANRFLGLFAGITFMPAGARTATVALDTAAALDGVRVDPSFFTVDGFRRENLPRVSFHVSTPNDFGHAAEYSWRLDRQTWSSFSTETRYEVQDFALASPGLHTIEVRARIAGEPESADAEPAQFTFIVDPVAPELTTRFDNDVLVAEATDNQSDALEYSFQFDGAPATEWGASSRVDVPDGAVRIVVRVRDAAGNVTERIINRQSLIRGGASTDASSGGCGCRVGSSSSSGGKGSAGLLGLFAAGVVIAARRRRRASAKVATALMVAATGVVASGCAEEATGVVQDGGNGDSGLPGTWARP